VLTTLSKIQKLLKSPDSQDSLSTSFDQNDQLQSLRSSQREFTVKQGIPILLPQQSDFAFGDSDESPVLRKRSKLAKFVSILINGGNPVARRNANKLIKKLIERTPFPRVLVVGAGQIGDGSEALYQSPDVEVISFDIYRSEFVNFVADGHHIPLIDGCVDAVWIQAVLEHVVSPSTVVTEMYRVLKPNGILYAETPFMQQVHEGRYDFQRFTEGGHRWLFRAFKRLDAGVVWGPGRTLQWAVRYFFWGVTRNKNLAIVLSLPFSFFRWFDRFIPNSLASDGACNLYFFGEKQPHLLTFEELLAEYNGAQ
jgi:SAM-dependent methyltransferase